MCGSHPNSSVQLFRHVRLFATPWTVARQASLSITNFWSLLKLMFIERVMPSNHFILCHPLLLLLSIFWASESFLMSQFCASVAKVLELQLQHQSFQWILYSGLISFRIDWFDLLVVQGTLKSLLQHHSSKASILRRSTFFIVQLSHLYMTTGKAIPLIVQTFVNKVMSLFFNMLSRFVIAFLTWSMHACKLL